MKLKSLHPSLDNARNLSSDKEQVNRIRIVALNPKYQEYAKQDYYRAYPDRLASQRFITVCDARFYMGRSSSASAVDCSVWIHGKNGEYRTGRGRATGYGYHKESAALEYALRAAGFEFFDSWGGSGEQAMNTALLIVARKIGFRNVGIL